MKIAYKGFDKDLKCRGEQFHVGEIYTKNLEVKNPRTCTGDGYHYCNKLNDVFTYYANNGQNRFCEIQILGTYTDDNTVRDSKSITTSFRIIREISVAELRSVLATQQTSKIERNLNLSVVQEIQERYPMFHVGGSVGLFLHGIRLERWAKKTSSDIDLISPYFVLVEGPEEDPDMVTHLDGKASANDFDETFLYDAVKVDYRIDPKQRYEVIEYNGFKYKVSPLLSIFEAKMRYAMNGQTKHKNDVLEIIKAGKVLNVDTTSKTSPLDEIPF